MSTRADHTKYIKRADIIGRDLVPNASLARERRVRRFPFDDFHRRGKTEHGAAPAAPYHWYRCRRQGDAIDETPAASATVESLRREYLRRVLSGILCSKCVSVKTVAALAGGNPPNSHSPCCLLQ
jgi:hypothetical protein